MKNDLVYLKHIMDSRAKIDYCAQGIPRNWEKYIGSKS